MKRGKWAGSHTARFSLGCFWFGWNLKTGQYFWLLEKGRYKVHYGNIPRWLLPRWIS